MKIVHQQEITGKLTNWKEIYDRETGRISTAIFLLGHHSGIVSYKPEGSLLKKKLEWIKTFPWWREEFWYPDTLKVTIEINFPNDNELLVWLAKVISQHGSLDKFLQINWNA